MYTDEAFEVYKAYQKKVHGKEDEDKEGYEGFLCQAPLFDPNDTKIPADASEAVREEYLKEQ